MVIYWIITGSHIINMAVMICYLMQIPFGAIGLWSLFMYNRQVLIVYSIINVVIGFYSSLICLYYGNAYETMDCANRNAYDIKRVNYCDASGISIFSNIVFVAYSVCFFILLNDIIVKNKI